MRVLKTLVNFFRRIINYLRSVEIVGTFNTGTYNSNIEFNRIDETISTLNSEAGNGYHESQITEDTNGFNGFGGGDFGGAGAGGSWDDNSTTSNDYSDPNCDSSSSSSNDTN